jgi:hydrogenase nickel incorporation protein HypB
MCSTCGCEGPGKGYTLYTSDGKHHHSHDDHHHSHGHHHSHSHHHDHDHHQDNHSHETSRIAVETDILGQNNLQAQRNRGYFDAKNIFAINLVSSPGSGKTSVLEKTIVDLKGKKLVYVIEGDQQTMNDAERIKKAGAPVVQINTGNGCHLDAEMVYKAVKELQPKEDSFLIIENVGNLVCPSLFDLGESKRVVIMSVTEGEDKPLKYPNMFQSSQVCIINKIDLLPYLRFDLAKAKEYALRVNPGLQFFELSVYTGQGMQEWYKWLEENNA